MRFQLFNTPQQDAVTRKKKDKPPVFVTLQSLLRYAQTGRRGRRNTPVFATLRRGRRNNTKN